MSLDGITYSEWVQINERSGLSGILTLNSAKRYGKTGKGDREGKRRKLGAESVSGRRKTSSMTNAADRSSKIKS